MNREEFVRLHDECTKSLKRWMAEATRTCQMLGDSLDKPLTLQQRSELHAQRIRENDAQAAHMDFRRRLFEMARLVTAITSWCTVHYQRAEIRNQQIFPFPRNPLLTMKAQT